VSTKTESKPSKVGATVEVIVLVLLDELILERVIERPDFFPEYRGVIEAFMVFDRDFLENDKENVRSDFSDLGLGSVEVFIPKEKAFLSF
jgi:hypothetical protein